MHLRVPTAIVSALILVVAASVATSQPPGEPGTSVGPATAGVVAPLGRGFAAATPLATGGVGAAGDMIGFSHVDGSGTQTITLVDTGKSWMAVYHVGRSGTIRLVSSRPIDADFSLQLNATSPLPEEIRRIGNQ